MPLQLLLAPRQPVAVIRVVGPVSLMDWSAALAGLVIHPRWPGPARVIVDRRSCPVLDSPQAAWAMAMLAADHREAFAGARWAVLVSERPTCYGIARIFTAGLESAGLDGAVFRDPDSALAWLLDGDDGDAPAPTVYQDTARWEGPARRLGERLATFRVGPNIPVAPKDDA